MSTFWKILIAVIVTAGVVGGGGWYFMDKKASDDQTKLQSQIDTLNKTVATLKSAATATTPSTSTTATTDATANWKTYTNNFLGFSIKYPSDYIADVSTAYQSTNENEVFISTKINSTKNKILLSVWGEQSSLNLDSYVASAVKDLAFGEATKLTFVAQPAYEGVDKGSLNSYGIIVKKGENIFRIVLDSGNVDGLAKSKTALTTVENQILSTFQFTK